ncbi:MAG: M48 family metalloprotease, partial [Alphaproteobacteria bacterium]|nr:M48 family metalloprotease [Alphaproteobacteria bacterium]
RFMEGIIQKAADANVTFAEMTYFLKGYTDKMAMLGSHNFRLLVRGFVKDASLSNNKQWAAQIESDFFDNQHLVGLSPSERSGFGSAVEALDKPDDLSNEEPDLVREAFAIASSATGTPLGPEVTQARAMVGKPLVAESTDGQVKLYPLSDANRVQQIANELALKSGMAPVPVYMTDRPGIKASAYTDAILLSRALMQGTEEEAGFAIAHEYCEIREGRTGPFASLKAKSSLARILDTVSWLRPATPEDAGEIAKFAAAGERADELLADRWAAMTVGAKAGMSLLFKAMADEPKDVEQDLPDILSSHPGNARRIVELYKLVKQRQVRL